MNVVSQDGRPGATISVRVRGGGSITQSNDPLYVVDGFPVSNIGDIPASEIESIDVLKDASSTAIYGARGANGVILVTTKSAKEGQIKVSYDGYVQVKMYRRRLKRFRLRNISFITGAMPHPEEPLTRMLLRNTSVWEVSMATTMPTMPM